MPSQLPKNRIIPISSFYSLLQLEYISYRFRALIYQRAFDCKKFQDICLKKKEKIDQIALENCLPSIFSNTGQQKKYLEKFFNECGPPNFLYRDDYQKQVKGYWDLYYYFIVGSSVRFTESEGVEIGRIESCSLKEKRLVIRTEDSKKFDKKFSEVIRIFPSDFYERVFK